MSTKGKHWTWKREKLANHNSASKYLGIDRRMYLFFRWARWRGISGKCPGFYWPCTRAGVMAFEKELGKIPADMVRPSVGRRDHSKGYEPGNIVWEEYNYNSAKRYANQDRFKKLDDEIARARKALDEDVPF